MQAQRVILTYHASLYVSKCLFPAENSSEIMDTCAGLGGGAARVVLPIHGGQQQEGASAGLGEAAAEASDSGKKRKAEAGDRTATAAKRRQSPDPEVHIFSTLLVQGLVCQCTGATAATRCLNISKWLCATW